MHDIERLLKEWADDFEAAAPFAPTRLQGTVLMTRAQECREQRAHLVSALNAAFQEGRNLSREQLEDQQDTIEILRGNVAGLHRDLELQKQMPDGWSVKTTPEGVWMETPFGPAYIPDRMNRMGDLLNAFCRALLKPRRPMKRDDQ